LTDASGKIQIDRYSRISSQGASIAFLDTYNHFGGWKVVFNSKNAWVQYNRVNFTKKSFKTVKVRAFSKTGSVLQIRLNNPKGPIIANIRIPQGNSWTTSKASVRGLKTGVENLVVSLADSNPVEADWIIFE
ncbi:MAG: carbohydrate-binding protein, partial [Bacteroidota bacterium]|nr:carbohydrate-binding protein [Bacteroidota bacterium]